jgi:stearoyl-CoA desaturase (delta-9 desaturase)
MNYFIGMFFVTAGYHRYFSHRSYKLGRVAQFIMAWMAQASAQKGVLWWAANHRDHHTYSDTEKDLHSPVQKGFWYSHVGWIFTPEAQTYNPKRITDFSKYPELRFLNKYHWLPTVSIAALIFAIGGLPALAWGYLFTIICMYQASYSVNSLAHVFGTKRFETTDDSRNNWFLAFRAEKQKGGAVVEAAS